MLVLSRKKGEQIRIGNDIVVTIQRLSGNRVSVGIEAPPSCRISRGELKTLLEELDYAPTTEQAEHVSAEPRREAQAVRPTLTSVVGENRIAAHLPPSLRSPK